MADITGIQSFNTSSSSDFKDIGLDEQNTLIAKFDDAKASICNEGADPHNAFDDFDKYVKQIGVNTSDGHGIGAMIDAENMVKSQSSGSEFQSNKLGFQKVSLYDPNLFTSELATGEQRDTGSNHGLGSVFGDNVKLGDTGPDTTVALKSQFGEDLQNNRSDDTLIQDCNEINTETNNPGTNTSVASALTLIADGADRNSQHFKEVVNGIMTGTAVV